MHFLHIRNTHISQCLFAIRQIVKFGTNVVKQHKECNFHASFKRNARLCKNLQLDIYFTIEEG